MPISRKRKKRPSHKQSNQTAAYMTREAKVAMQKHQDGSGHFQGELYQGAFPSPDMLKGYQEVDPNLPNRLFEWTETESKHRRSLEARVVNGSMILAALGIVAGLATVAGLGYLSYLFMINGHPTAGASIAVSIAGVVSVFIYRKAKKDREEKPK